MKIVEFGFGADLYIISFIFTPHVVISLSAIFTL